MKTKIITREGYLKLQQELDYLWRDERPKITKIVTWAASLGDRSENADYTFNKRKLREIDRRVRFLRKYLFDVKVVDYNPQQEGAAYFGAWVNLENDDGKELDIRIVGPEEIYWHRAYISVDSPMAKACLGKRVDDEISVTTPEGNKFWIINEISYRAAAE
ncbi:transcription elongation factor GreB [Reinekea marinisedimentorum]|uniref:Transcription elongation factor GreB n=1 Tax=Reinekea marinisedimentorum TaxID=230495 RepID=A0A4R3HRY4_9GAMM|nr:transcription elongation factor GreB [Reinekea marinisedimentorum]TCS35896.1 transcription elongation factor GreB [Reinekea marinisedimentorum]